MHVCLCEEGICVCLYVSKRPDKRGNNFRRKPDQARTHKKEKKTVCVFCTAISTTVQTVGCFTKRKTTSAVSERESRKEKTLRLGREVIA